MVDLLAAVTAAAAEHAFSGAVRVDDGGDVVLAAAYGFTDRAYGVANTTDSQFALASGSKAFTAIAVLALVDDGVLALTTTARSVLGTDLPLIADDVTVEHLLAHRSGIGDYLDEDEEHDPADYVLTLPVHILDTTEAFLPMLDGHPTKFPAGERFSYCNGGYMVLALIAERTSGVPFHDLVGERVLRPAAMADTAYLRSDELPGRAARGYLDADGLRTNVLHLPVRGNGDGGIYSTLADVATFWRALFGGRLLPERLVADMTRSRSEGAATGYGYGLGLWLPEPGGAAQLEGADTGVSFRSTHEPATGRTVTVVGNTSDGAWPIARLLGERLAG